MATATHNGTGTLNGHGPAEPENPLHRLTPEQIEQIGKEFDELHEQVKADLGERDAAYIRGVISLQRRLALLGRVILFGSRSRQSGQSPSSSCACRRPSRALKRSCSL